MRVANLFLEAAQQYEPLQQQLTQLLNFKEQNQETIQKLQSEIQSLRNRQGQTSLATTNSDGQIDASTIDNFERLMQTMIYEGTPLEQIYDNLSNPINTSDGNFWRT